MNRAILSLWPYFWPLVRRFLLVFAFVVGFAFLTGHLYLIAALLPGIVLTVKRLKRPSWVWRLFNAVRHFETTRVGRITIHYAPQLSKEWDFSLLLQCCETEFSRLTDLFSDLRCKRATVFLFATHQEVGNVFGSHVAGTALRPLRAIVIAYDQEVQEHVRHEFAHLFSGRWNLRAPPILSEGLSVWLQGSEFGYLIDQITPRFLNDHQFALSNLLDHSFFFSEKQRYPCYLLAGSFTGFLIRRYGWEKYRQFFRSCDVAKFAGDFAKHFRVSMEEAERQWRAEIAVTALLIHRVKNKMGPTCRRPNR